MNLKLTSLALGAILAAGSGPLGAQAAKWTEKLNATAAIGLGTDNLHSVTNNGTSWWNIGTYNIDVGYTGKFAATDIPFRVSFGYNSSPAGSADEVYFRRSLTGYQFAADLFLDSRVVANMQFLIGMSLNQWAIDETILEDGYRETYTIPGTKFGGRVGLEYKLSNSLAFNVLFQFAEIGIYQPSWGEPLRPLPDPNTGERPWPEMAERPLNASWLQLGLKFSF